MHSLWEFRICKIVSDTALLIPGYIYVSISIMKQFHSNQNRPELRGFCIFGCGYARFDCTWQLGSERIFIGSELRLLLMTIFYEPPDTKSGTVATVVLNHTKMDIMTLPYQSLLGASSELGWELSNQFRHFVN